MNDKTNYLKRKPQMNDSEFDMDPNEEIGKKVKVDVRNFLLMPVHIVTCGLQGSDLGRDETAIIQICVNLIDVTNMEIIGERNIVLKASSLLDSEADSDKIHISIPSREMTGIHSIPNDDLHTNILDALDEINNFISPYVHNGDNEEVDVIPITVGHLPLRSVLHREARFRNIILQKYWFSYFELCEQMSIFNRSKFTNLDEICSALQLMDSGHSSGIIYNMTQAVLHLLRCNHNFNPFQTIVNSYKPAVFHIDDPIPDNVVVMIKPIDYKTPISQVLPFFNGVNIADGGVAVVMSEGRRSNKILIRFVDTIQRDIALLRDKHHLEPGSTRYITMSTFESGEFMKIAGYENDDVKNYLNQLTNQLQFLLRMKGLPFTVTKNDILQFFNSHGTEIQFGLNGIFLVQKPSGELNGDAFIIFKNEEESTKATNLKGSIIGNRYVEIFHSTPAEMNQVIAGIKNGTNLSKLGKKSNKIREIENSESRFGSYQASFGLLNGGLIQNPQFNRISSVGGVIMTSQIPKEARDSDFLNFLGDIKNSCISISRCNLQNPTGYTSYIAGFKDMQCAEMAGKALLNKPFKIDSINKDYHVTTMLPPIASAPINKSYHHNQIMHKSALNPINLVSTVLPLTTSMMYPSFNICNPLQSSNGSLINYGSMPSIYSLDQYNPLNLFTNMFQSNLFSRPLPNHHVTQPPVISNTHLNIQSSNTNPLLSTLNLAYVSKPIFDGKTNTVLLYGVQIQLFQNDFDIIFNSIAQSITALPKMYQYNQSFYAVFISQEDVKTALLRCPIILYKNQTIHLISIDQ